MNVDQKSLHTFHLSNAKNTGVIEIMQYLGDIALFKGHGSSNIVVTMEGEEALWSPFSTLNRILEILADSTGSLARGGRHKHQFLEITKFFLKSWINIFLCLAIRNFCIISLVQKASNFKLFFTVYLHMSQYIHFCFDVSIVIPMQATAAPTSKSPV